MVKLFLAMASAGLLVFAWAASASAQEGYPAKQTDEAVRNALAFHMVDFIGWNNRDWNVMRRLHTDDVKVDVGGVHTEGIDAHIVGIEQMEYAQPRVRVSQHLSIVAQGEWTCMVGLLTTGSRVATVAKWRNGAIAEEYLFLTEQPSGAPRPALKGDGVLRISNDGANPALFHIAGAAPGWSCEMGKGADDKRVAIFTHREGSDVRAEQIFNEY